MAESTKTGVVVTKGQIRDALKLLKDNEYEPDENKPWFLARHIGMVISPGTHQHHVAMANAIVKMRGKGEEVPVGYKSSVLHFGNSSQSEGYEPFAKNTYKVGNVSCSILAYGCSVHKVSLAKAAVGKCDSSCEYGIMSIREKKFMHTMLEVVRGDKKATRSSRSKSATKTEPTAESEPEKEKEAEVESVA